MKLIAIHNLDGNGGERAHRKPLACAHIRNTCVIHVQYIHAIHVICCMSKTLHGVFPICSYIFHFLYC